MKNNLLSFTAKTVLTLAFGAAALGIHNHRYPAEFYIRDYPSLSKNDAEELQASIGVEKAAHGIVAGFLFANIIFPAGQFRKTKDTKPTAHPS